MDIINSDNQSGGITAKTINKNSNVNIISSGKKWWIITLLSLLAMITSIIFNFFGILDFIKKYIKI